MKTTFSLAIALVATTTTHLATALSCTGKTCSYEYTFQKKRCKKGWFGFPSCSWHDTQYKWCAQKWGSKPSSSYGDLAALFGDDDRIKRNDSTGSNAKCKDRTDIETRYKQQTGSTCEMRWDKKEWANAAYQVPCWDDSARRRVLTTTTGVNATNIHPEGDNNNQGGNNNGEPEEQDPIVLPTNAPTGGAVEPPTPSPPTPAGAPTPAAPTPPAAPTAPSGLRGRK